MACRGSSGSQQNSGTSASITVKTLKSKIDGNDLDLSMSGLVSVPVKELNAVKRGTHLDLSCNQLTELSEDFCSLTHLVRLDLSQNQLVSLPENFGNLINLQELDLYKNRLTTLPVSFCRLKLLKWLDLKDNPLTDDLRAATGDCLDEKQCQQAAQKVVQFMQKVQSDQERERQRKLQKQREEEHAKKLLEETNRREQQAIKKREKERRRHEHRQRDLHSNTVQKEARFAERIGKPTRVEAHNQRMVQKSSFVSKFLGCLRAIIGLLLLLLFVACCVLLVGGFILYSNCSSRPEFIPGSRPLCHDLYLWSTTGRAPNVQNVKAAFSGLNSVVADRSKALFDQIVAVDYGVWASKVRSLFTSLSDELKSKDYGGLVENSIGWAKNKTLVLSSWCQNETGPWVRRSLSTSKLQAVWVWEKIKMFTRWLLDKTLKFAERFLLTIGQIIDNMPYYWEKAKFYWNNMK